MASKVVGELLEKVVLINKVAKVVKGGRRFSFAALVVVGDAKGVVGYGKGKAKEVQMAIAKAIRHAKANLIRIPLKDNRTFHHDVKGKSGAGSVVMRRARPGTGLIAGGVMRPILEVLGVVDVVCKSIGSNNAYTLLYSTFNGLKLLESPKIIGARRDRSVGMILGTANKQDSAASDTKTGHNLSSFDEETEVGEGEDNVENNFNIQHANEARVATAKI